MIAFDVYLNGKKQCRAGVGDAGVLSGMVTHVVKHDGSEPPDTDLRVGGMRTHTEAREHEYFLTTPLIPGDEVRFVVVESSSCDRPMTKKAALKAMTLGRLAGPPTRVRKKPAKTLKRKR